MPYVQVEPDVYLEHKGVTVWHTYKEGTDEECQYHFTTDPKTADECHFHGTRGHFDARLLAARWERTPTVGAWNDYWKPRFRTEEECIEALIRAAIEEGRLPCVRDTRP